MICRRVVDLAGILAASVFGFARPCPLPVLRFVIVPPICCTRPNSVAKHRILRSHVELSPDCRT